MLAVEGLACERGGRRLFAGLSFAVEPGMLLQVTGANGAGKTSLLRILCGLLAPVAGTVRWRDAAIESQRETYGHDLRYIGHLAGIKDELSAEENLRYTATLSGLSVTRDALRAALDALGLGRFARAPVRTLSQGQRRRVALARLALPDPAALWVLDEPLVALDTDAAAIVQRLIDARLAAGAVVVMTSHQSFTVTALMQSITLAE